VAAPATASKITTARTGDEDTRLAMGGPPSARIVLLGRGGVQRRQGFDARDS